MSYIPDAEDTVPVFKFGDDGKIRNIRPTIYHRRAAENVKRYSPQGYLGYVVENTFGQRNTMTFKQYERLKNLEALGGFKVVDYWRNHYIAPEIGLTGYDTEMERSGLYELPSYGS